jgi:hypothetical protein
VILVDLDLDGDLDITTANAGDAFPPSFDSVSVLMNTGGGAFADHVEYSSAGEPPWARRQPRCQAVPCRSETGGGPLRAGRGELPWMQHVTPSPGCRGERPGGRAHALRQRWRCVMTASRNNVVRIDRASGFGLRASGFGLS